MRSKIKRAIALVCTLICATTSFVACGGPGGTLVDNKSKTQLYIGNYDGGYGSRWLDAYKKGFEEMYKDVSFEEGKKGVEVQIINDKVAYYSSTLISTLDQSAIDIIFTEGFGMYRFLEDGLLYDITDIGKETIPGEDKTIEDKLSAQQKEYYTSFDGKYYCLPHFQSLRGIVYDIDLFNQKGLYIKANGDISGISTDTDLSNGPDGIQGTYDDGLPATYDEFFKWCDYVSKYKQVTPICWTGAYKEAYVKYLLDSLMVDAQGLEAGQYMYSNSDKTVNVKVIESFANTGLPVVTEKAVSRDNARDMSKSAAAYYALTFLRTIIDNNYYFKQSMNELETHDLIHYDFLRSRFDPQIQPIAMMIEGAWWEEESDYIFDELSLLYEGAGRDERNFGFMPLPKPTEDYIGPMTLLDANNSTMLVNANCSAVDIDLVKKFIQYISTDANLQLFNTIVGVPRDYYYSLTTEQENSLSAFAKSLAEARKNSTGIVYARTNCYNDYTYDQLNNSLVNFNTSSATGAVGSVINTFSTTNVTARDYFEGIGG